MRPFNRFTLLGIFLSMPIVACAEQEPANKQAIEKKLTNQKEKTAPSAATHQQSITANGDIFMRVQQEGGATEANYFSTQVADQETLAKRMIWMLEQVEASPQIIEFAKSRLPTNRRLNNDQFTLPLTDKDGITHQFIYHSNSEYHFYTINYQKI